MSQRNYRRNAGARRSTNGQPGQWSPLRAYLGGPGIDGSETVMQFEASQYGCTVDTNNPASLLPSLTCKTADGYVTVTATAMTYNGEDAAGTLFALRFPCVLETGWPWYIMIPANWPCVRARDGSSIAGIVLPSGGVPVTPPGWIGVSNIADNPPPSGGNPPLWVPINIVFVSPTSMQFQTGGTAFVEDPDPASYFANGIPGDAIFPVAPGLYQVSSAAWAFTLGEFASITMDAYVPTWQLADGKQLGIVLNTVQFPV